MITRFVVEFLVTIAASLSMVNVAAQGQVFFNNRVADNVNAPVAFLNGTRVGAGFSAQLIAGPEGTSVDRLTPLQRKR